MSKYLKLFDNHKDYSVFKETTDLILPNVSHCIEENEVHYNPIPDPYSGHAYVDLGLPSGTKWATMNVGANSETDYGLYFAWGETEGYADASTKAFSWNDYKYGTSTNNFTKYNTTDGKTVLDLEDDAAHVNWGGDWHMPTKEQCEELCNTTYITNAWVTDYNGSGINGRLFTSVINGNTMFIPAAGRADGGIYGLDVNGYVYVSALSSQGGKYAWDFSFVSGNEASVNYINRYNGLSVRGVVG